MRILARLLPENTSRKKRGRNGSDQAGKHTKTRIDSRYHVAELLSPPYACAVKKRREVIVLIQLAAGIVLGIMTSAVVAMVGCCIYMEKKYPELMDEYRLEMER